MLREPFARLLENRFTRPFKREIVRSIAAMSKPRAILNQCYGMLSEEAKSRFHARYAKIFREHNARLSVGEWSIKFAGHTVRLPLRPQYSWLDWDNAVSIVGHDIEIKQTYAALIESGQRPRLFLDVGANYGMHSVLFLSAGIPAIAFEPNQSCFSYFEAVCELNGFHGRWEQVALGNKSGDAELIYPETETWLGSVSTDVIPTLKKLDHVISRKVPLKKLDDYLSDIPRDGILIKIDVEGSELDVLRGASQILGACKPKIIFESNDVRTRPDLHRLLEKFGYSVHLLPWRPSVDSKCQAREEFLVSSARNFIAIVSDRPVTP